VQRRMKVEIDLAYLLEVLKDVQVELGEPEVAEFISMKLDAKIERAINMLTQENDLG